MGTFRQMALQASATRVKARHAPTGANDAEGTTGLIYRVMTVGCADFGGIIGMGDHNMVRLAMASAVNADTGREGPTRLRRTSAVAAPGPEGLHAWPLVLLVAHVMLIRGAVVTTLGLVVRGGTPNAPPATRRHVLAIANRDRREAREGDCTTELAAGHWCVPRLARLQWGVTLGFMDQPACMTARGRPTSCRGRDRPAGSIFPISYLEAQRAAAVAQTDKGRSDPQTRAAVGTPPELAAARCTEFKGEVHRLGPESRSAAYRRVGGTTAAARQFEGLTRGLGPTEPPGRGHNPACRRGTRT